jgi:hypothetical protein
MDALTAFGFAVSAVLICYALEDRSHWFVRRSPDHVRSGRHTASCKAHGRSERLRPSSRLWRCAAGIKLGHCKRQTRPQKVETGQGFALMAKKLNL